MNTDKGKLPALLFYGEAWLNDIALRRCSPGARSLWIDMISIMQKGEPYGHLQVNGVPIEYEELAEITRNRKKNVQKWLKELSKNNVCGSTKNGVIYSRRMVRDEAKRLINQQNGKKGGNPNIVQGVNPPLNHPVNPRVKASYTKLREDVKDLEPSALVRSEKPHRTNETPYEELREEYNKRRGALPEARGPLSEPAKKKVVVRWRAHPDINFWKSIFEKAGRSDTMVKWASFHWLIESEMNLEKTMNGNYDNERETKFAPRVSRPSPPRPIEKEPTPEEIEENRLAAKEAIDAYWAKHPRVKTTEEVKPSGETREIIEEELPV